MNIKKFQPELAEIAELRQLDRLGAAKQRWRFLLEKLSQEEQLQIALSQYANEQNWFELGVDGSIIAKAWDYIGLRLPNAYSQYFDIALSNVNLSETEHKPLWIIVSPKLLRWPLLAKKVLGIQWRNLLRMRVD